MRRHYERILKDCDMRVKRSFALQVMNSSDSINYGGFRDKDGLIEPKFSIYRVTTMIACLFNKESKWYQDRLTYERILLGLDYIKRSQRENGFFDLINCNFYSGPDTAFCIKRLLPTYYFLSTYNEENSNKNNDNNKINVNCIDSELIKTSLKDIIYKGAKAMVNGGFHTPNHRWALASTLLLCYKLFGEEEFKLGADKYLIEGIDCNEDGEFAERSAGNYNRINNDAMITIAVATGDDTYYEYAKRNLNMMLTYIEPDGSIFTNNSTRQDRGKKVYPKDYYMEYLYMGVKFNDQTFLDAANNIMDIVEEKGLTTMDCLILFMIQPELIEFEHNTSNLPNVYHKHYKESDIVRCRRDSYSYSIINHSPTFLYFQHGDLTLSLKIGASFCEHRAFISQTLTQTEYGYNLSERKVGWYYLPFEKAQDTTDWWKMDNASRDKLYGPNMDFDIQITEVDGGLDIRLKTDGIDRAPLRLELAFDAGTRIESEHFIAEGIPGGGMVAKDGMVTAAKGDYAIEVGPAFGNHNFVAGKFGSEGRNPHCYTVYFTDHSCFDHTISLRAKPSTY